jgi:hypothetical protein
MEAVEVIKEIVRVNPRIKFLNFYVFPVKPHDNISKRINEETVSMPERLFHPADKKEEIRLGREEITAEVLQEIIHSLQNVSSILVLGALSEVEIHGKTFHIPMMDFDCSNSEKSIEEIKQFLQYIGQKEGVILFSGMSFHYYGTNLLDEKGLWNFLGDCLLSGLTGQRYVGHRLKEQRLILRISACPLRPQIPTVVSIIGATP